MRKILDQSASINTSKKAESKERRIKKMVDPKIVALIFTMAVVISNAFPPVKF